MQLNTPTHVTVVDNAKPLTETVSKELLSRNSDFGVFVERMKSIGRAFVVKDKKTNELSLVSLSEDESNFDTWADCCLRDYLERKRIFENRFKTRRNLIMRIVAITICFAVMLASFWPLWEVLIDVEADVYYKTLGLHSSSSPSEIKRAYREQVKIWHPDKNPSCGETCRLQMIKIQEAHNVLLSRGDHSFELANKYRNELLQLRSLVFFRVYQISLCAAQELLEIILRLFSGTTTNHNFVLGVACKAATMAFFTLYEGLYVSSFNFGMLISILYFGVTVTKSSVEEVKVQSVKKKSYMDLGQEALVLLVPLVLGSLGYACHWSASPWEDLFRCAFGCCYVMAFLYRFSPNIHDNFVMRKCSLPLEFVNFTTLNFSWLNFFFAEFGFVFDDLFVFTCRIPPIFRIVVYMIHCVFLCQFFMLPWDAPITGRNAQRIKQSEESISSKRSTVDQTSTQPTADALSEMTRVSDQARSQGDLARDAQQQRPQAVNRSLLSEEIQLIQGLDDETTTWLNIPMLKYSHLVAALQNSNKSDNNVSKIEILSSSDLQRVIFVRQNYDTAGGLKKKPNSPQFSVLLEIVDPDMSRLLALERGPTSVFPAKGVASAEDCNAAYRLLFTVNSNATSSLLWHQKAVSGINKSFGVFLIGSRQFAAVVVVLFALLLLLLVSALDVRGTCRSTTRELSPIVMNLGSLAVCCPDA